MKKIYEAPALDLLAFLSASPISADSEEDLALMDSNAWNNGELGWT